MEERAGASPSMRLRERRRGRRGRWRRRDVHANRRPVPRLLILGTRPEVGADWNETCLPTCAQTRTYVRTCVRVRASVARWISEARSARRSATSSSCIRTRPASTRGRGRPSGRRSRGGSTATSRRWCGAAPAGWERDVIYAFYDVIVSSSVMA